MNSSTEIETISVEVYPAEESATAAVALLAAVADPVRWRLLALLADGRTRCVCALQPLAGIPGNLLSYHLKVLRDAGLVSTARRGRWVDYTIAPDTADRLRAALPTQAPTPSAMPGAAAPPGATVRPGAADPSPVPGGRR